jgi:exodeoxyribonuclease VII large subunit
MPNRNLPSGRSGRLEALRLDRLHGDAARRSFGLKLGNVCGVSETFTVRELCRAIGAVIDHTFPDEVWVKGAISGLNRSPNGHAYFDLIEPSDDAGALADAVLPVALFAASRHRVNHILRRSGGVRMHDGVEIRVRGRVAYYPPQGRVQLVMSLIDPAYTVGLMAAARQALLDKLAAEGLLNANRAHVLPALPMRIGLVTSDRSAAHADFVHELEASGYAFAVTLFDSRVQGIDAVPSLVDGIEAAGRTDVDVVVVIRGGGARTDLAAFDHERVARAIAACNRPVLVGVGHEVDRSVADEVAHSSAKTPTATAAVLVDAVRSFEHHVEQTASRLASLASARLDAMAGSLAVRANQLAATADRTVDRHRNRLDTSTAQLRHRTEMALDRVETAVDRAELRLGAHDPARLLGRGWSITHIAGGDLVRAASQVGPGTRLVTTTASGAITSTVDPLEAAGDHHG